ncbi:hypothetical protein ABH926_005463 [Catenulispora sp. GP43]
MRFEEPTEDGMIRWKPVAMAQTPDFSEVESALAVSDQTLHPDLITLYGSYWCGDLEGDEHSGEPVSLVTVFNEQGLRDLVDSLAVAVRRQVEDGLGDITFPVAATGSDVFFVLDNATGRILLQEAGYPPQKVVAPSLTQFLAEL